MKVTVRYDDYDRNLIFPTVTEKLKDQPELTFVALWENKKKHKLWLEDSDGYFHEGIDINLN